VRREKKKEEENSVFFRGAVPLYTTGRSHIAYQYAGTSASKMEQPKTAKRGMKMDEDGVKFER
jgi:hypothetical protein